MSLHIKKNKFKKKGFQMEQVLEYCVNGMMVLGAFSLIGYSLRNIKKEASKVEW